jgi:hypothetical protein
LLDRRIDRAHALVVALVRRQCEQIIERAELALICLARSCSVRTNAASAGSLATTRALESASACCTAWPRTASARPKVSTATSFDRLWRRAEYADIGLDDSLQPALRAATRVGSSSSAFRASPPS